MVKKALVILAIFSIVFAGHFASSHISHSDSMWSIYTAVSLLREADTDLDEYEEILRASEYYAIETIRGHYYTIFPAGVSFLALPFVFASDLVLNSRVFQNELVHGYIAARAPNRPPAPEDLMMHHIIGIEFAIACFFVACTAVCIYMMSRMFVDETRSWLMALIFAFATTAWSTASRGLWQHGPSMLMLSLALYLILRARTQEWVVALAGLPLALAYVVRPTNSIPAFFLSIFVLLKHRRHFVSYLACLATVWVPFLIFNLRVYGGPLAPYYLPSRIGASSTFWEALLGNLISPARGLFVFMPFLVFSLYGVILKFRQEGLYSLPLFLVLILVVHWITISSFPHWWAGHSFGPRFFCDMLPFLFYFLIPVVNQIPRLQRGRIAVGVAFACLVLISVFIHYRGANNLDVVLWNDRPVSVDQAPERIWDWRDPSFLRGL